MRTETTKDYPQEKLQNMLLFLNWNFPVPRLALEDLEQRLLVLMEEALKEARDYRPRPGTAGAGEYLDWCRRQFYEQQHFRLYLLLLYRSTDYRDVLGLESEQVCEEILEAAGFISFLRDPLGVLGLEELRESFVPGSLHDGSVLKTAEVVVSSIELFFMLLDFYLVDADTENRNERDFADGFLLRNKEAAFFEMLFDVSEESLELMGKSEDERERWVDRVETDFDLEIVDNFRILPADVSRPYLLELIPLLDLGRKFLEGEAVTSCRFPYPLGGQVELKSIHFEGIPARGLALVKDQLLRFLKTMELQVMCFVDFQARFPYRYRLLDHRNLNRPQQVIRFLVDDPYFLSYYNEDPQKVLEHIRRSEDLQEDYIRTELDRLRNKESWTDEDHKNLRVATRYRRRFDENLWELE